MSDNGDGGSGTTPPEMDTQFGNFTFGSNPEQPAAGGDDDPDDPFANIKPLDVPDNKPGRKRVQLQIDADDDSDIDHAPPKNPMAGRAGRKRMSVIDAIALEHHAGKSGSEEGSPMPMALSDFATRSKRRASMLDAVNLMETSVQSPLSSGHRPSRVEIDKATIGKAEFQNIRRMFHLHDEDDSGAIDSKELGRVMLSLGHQLTAEQLNDLMYEITGDRQCEALDFEDFVKLILFWKDAARFRLFERETAPATQHIEAATNTGGMVLPDHPLRRLWDVVMMLSLIFIWGTVTFYYSIVGDETAIDRYKRYLVPLECINSGLLLLDAIINCFTVVIDGRHLVTDGREIRMNYVRRWLAVDVIAILPYWLMIPSPAAGYINWVRVVRFLRWPAMFRTSGRIPMDPSFVTFYYQVLPILEGLAVFALLVHTSAVVMIYQQPDRALSLNYSSGIYWALLVISSVGSDVVPGTNDTDGKRWYAMSVMLIGQFVNAVAVGNIVRYFQIADISAVRASKLAETAAVCQFFSIPEALSNEILQFQDHVLQHNLSLAYFNLIKGLPPEMKVHIGIYARIRFIQDHPIFMLGHEAVRVAVAQALDAVVYTPEEYVIIADDVDEDMFVVASGFLDVLSRRGGYMLTLKPGDHFGEVSLFHEAPHAVSVKTLTYCELYALCGQVFDNIMERFPTFRRSVDAYLSTLAKAPSSDDVLATSSRFVEAMAESFHDHSTPGTPLRMQYLNDLSFLPRKRWETRLTKSDATGAPKPLAEPELANELRNISVSGGVISPRASLSPQTPRRAWGNMAASQKRTRGTRQSAVGWSPSHADTMESSVAPNISELDFRRVGSDNDFGSDDSRFTRPRHSSSANPDEQHSPTRLRIQTDGLHDNDDDNDEDAESSEVAPLPRAARRSRASGGAVVGFSEDRNHSTATTKSVSSVSKAAKKKSMEARKQAARANDVMALAQTELSKGNTSGTGGVGADSVSPVTSARQSIAGFGSFRAFNTSTGTSGSHQAHGSMSESEEPMVPPAMESAAIDALIRDIATQMAEIDQLVAAVGGGGGADSEHGQSPAGSPAAAPASPSQLGTTARFDSQHAIRRTPGIKRRSVATPAEASPALVQQANRSHSRSASISGMIPQHVLPDAALEDVDAAEPAAEADGHPLVPAQQTSPARPAWADFDEPDDAEHSAAGEIPPAAK